MDFNLKVCYSERAITRTTGTVRYILDNIDLSKQELLDIFETIRMLKEADMQGAVPKILKGASLAMINALNKVGKTQKLMH
ncbi:hypothetical protein G9F72_026535 [Clostridium estertheticum]|uniref:hypothetical protein n=1 Tax=Clostridium estertheticum TaxID=238834 RepID=UPI001CD0CA24|nr:hypothetical protein [Clostridium estertheticum]MBZ9689832.1 hypothetical protein [Clostridium estertheticum]